MKEAILSLILLTTSLGFNPNPKKQLLSAIPIGKYSYKIYKETRYVHDEYRNIDFFVVYGMNNEQLCSAYMFDKVNDSAYIKGHFSFTKKYLEFREYFYNSTYQDSIIKRFYPNKVGKLILLRHIAYKNGVERITKY